MNFVQGELLGMDPSACYNGTDAQAKQCRRLVGAIMLQALQDWRLKAAPAIDWFNSDSNKPFGFRWCCDVLDLDAQRVRGRLR